MPLPEYDYSTFDPEDDLADQGGDPLDAGGWSGYVFSPFNAPLPAQNVDHQQEVEAWAAKYGPNMQPIREQWLGEHPGPGWSIEEQINWQLGY